MIFGCGSEAERHELGGWVSASRVPSLKILSTFCSDMPLIPTSVFLGVNARLSSVWKPASLSFLQSEAEMPNS